MERQGIRGEEEITGGEGEGGEEGEKCWRAVTGIALWISLQRALCTCTQAEHTLLDAGKCRSLRSSSLVTIDDSQ